NQIESIEVDAFSIDKRSYYGPGLIEKLDLSFNKLVHLNESIFSYLTNLRYLIISHNRLRYIDPAVFQGVNYLISLDLRLNKLENLTFLTSRNFSELRHLRLANNQIEFLRPGQFMHLKSLNFLDLSANNIKYITTCAFYGLQNTIRRLFLNWNQISRLNTCAFTLAFKHLRFVQIMHNPLNCTNNCEFFFTVYNPPYSINYQGVECLNNTLSFTRVCSQRHYDYIYSRCQSEAQSLDCAALLYDHNFDFRNEIYFDYDYNIEKMMLQEANSISPIHKKLSLLVINTENSTKVRTLIPKNKPPMPPMLDNKSTNSIVGYSIILV
ncbi:insulin-like growth factor-binding complex acid labile subunit, partial [Brachionus plicatilis]